MIIRLASPLALMLAAFAYMANAEGQSTNRPTTDQCDLRVWPFMKVTGDIGNAGPSPLASALIHNRRKAIYSQLLPTLITPQLQKEALTTVLAQQNPFPDGRSFSVTMESTPYRYGELKNGPRLANGTSSCYLEIIILDISFMSSGTWTKLTGDFYFRRFEGDRMIDRFHDWRDVQIELMDQKTEADRQLAVDGITCGRDSLFNQILATYRAHAMKTKAKGRGTALCHDGGELRTFGK